MQLFVTGKSRYVNHEVIEEAARFFGEYLFKRLYKKVTIDLILSSKDMPKNVDGYCDWSDNNKKPRYFEIQLRSNMSEDNLLRTLAHEMVHVKQYAKGELTDHMCGKKSRWKDTVINVENHDYWELPWEIEAYGREKGLYNKYLQYAFDTNFLNKVGALYGSTNS